MTSTCRVVLEVDPEAIVGLGLADQMKIENKTEMFLTWFFSQLFSRTGSYSLNLHFIAKSTINRFFSILLQKFSSFFF